MTTKRKIAVVGLGYVGLPVTIALAREEFSVIGFDIDRQRVGDLREDRDRTGAVSSDELAETGAVFTSASEEMGGADFYIVAVPTPVDAAKNPDLTALRKASRIVGSVLRPGDVVVYESTVYPGATREVCGPLLEEASGLTCGEEFFLGYSPERVVPGDADHTFERAVKVVSGQDERTLDIVAEVYGAVVQAGIHRASSIEVAEAVKVVENVQRDVNIAVVNELALIFHRLGIDTLEVLEAAGTKWNFLPFRPGLVGGHCIGVDPYYLTARAQEVGFTPKVIPAARAVNESMAPYIAQETIRQLGRLSGRRLRPKVGILGLAFKEDVPDLRNSLVPDIVAELESFGAAVMVHDPLCDPELARQKYGLELWPLRDMADSDALVLAVPHEGVAARCIALAVDGARGCVVMDVKGAIPRGELPDDVIHWRL